MRHHLPLLLTSLVFGVFGGCTVGATLPFGKTISTGGYYPTASSSSGGESYVEGGGDGGGGGGAPARPARKVDGYDVEIACVGDTAGATFAQAAPLGKGTQRGCIDGGPTTDVYALTASDHPSGTLFEIKMQAPNQICASFYNQNRERLNHECVDGNEVQALWISLAPSTTGYLYMKRTHNEASAYQLDVKERHVDDVNEPNNSWKDATKIALGEEQQAYLHMTVNDRRIGADYYKVKVASPGKLVVRVDPQSDDVETELEIFNADHTKIESAYAPNPGAVVREGVEVQPGTYYIVLSENRHYSEYPYGTGKPSSHYATPYVVSVDMADEGESKKKKRVSRR